MCLRQDGVSTGRLITVALARRSQIPFIHCVLRFHTPSLPLVLSVGPGGRGKIREVTEATWKQSSLQVLI